MKSTSIITLSLFCVSILFFNQCNDKLQTAGQVSIHLNDQADSTQYYSYKIDFPDTLHYAPLAKALKEYATSSLDNYFTIMPEDTSKWRFAWQLIVDYSEVLNSTRFLAYKATYYRFTGGAHGMPATITFVFDKKIEQIISLEDLFSDTTAAIKAISLYARDAVAKKVYDGKTFRELDSTTQEWVTSGTVPVYKNFETFLPANITQDGVAGLKIIFSPYQVAAYVYGMPAIIIPAKQFYDYLAPEYKKVFIQR